MDVKIWEGGLQEQEVSAIEKIKAAFSNDNSTARRAAKKVKGSSLADVLQSAGFSDNSMFPWRGYAGFRFVNSKGKEGEFDLVIITHGHVLIIELKDWNHAPVTAQKGHWYKGGKDMGRSPVSVTQNKVYTLKGKLDKIKHRFTNKNYVPFIDFFVVMTGNADFSQLSEDADRKHTLSLDDFLQFADRKIYEKHLQANRHSNANRLYEDFHLFDELFLGTQAEAKKLRIGGYEAKEEIFVHPNKVYREYVAGSEISANSEALLRVWDFSQVEGVKGHTASGRADIVARERQVLEHINHQNRDLYNHCLRSLTSFQKDELTTQYCEVYELPPGHERFNQFIGKFGGTLSPLDRLNIVKLLVAKFGDLHEMKIAHRDIADHSLWISPSKEVALSNFISAYHQPVGTVGDYRQGLSVGAVAVDEMLEGRKLTPFEKDVHSLGLVAWHIFTAQRLSPTSCETLQTDMQTCEEWYGPVLLKAATAQFTTAAAFFDALKQAEPAKADIPVFDDEELEPYRRAINLSRTYREDNDFIVETDEKEVYVSGGRLVKAWLNCGLQGHDPATNFHVLNFLQRVDKLRTVQATYLPAIRDYGIASKSNSLYLVTDCVDGETWDKVDISAAGWLEIIPEFIAAIEHLHELGCSHGDLHPGNVMIERETNSLFLIDIPDFTPSIDEPKNHLYSPENIDSCTAFERDNFAVMKMVSELFELRWGEVSSTKPELANAIQLELQDRQFGFKDLGRFKQALNVEAASSNQQIIEIVAGNAAETITLLPDNGRLYVAVEKNARNPNEAIVEFNGVGGIFSAAYNLEQKSFVVGFSPKSRSSVNHRAVSESQHEISVGIRVVPGRPHSLSALTNHFQEDVRFDDIIKGLFTSENDCLENSHSSSSDEVLTEELRQAFDKIFSPVEKQQARKALNITTDKLWRAILETETESHPNIDLDGVPLAAAESSDELILSYSSDVDPLGTFNRIDEVEALQVDDEGNEHVLGWVNLKSSALSEVRIVKIRRRANQLKEGDIVYFRSNQDRASYRKRKAALQKLLDREGVTPDLIELFDSDCSRLATQYGISLSDEHFSRYDRYDQQGNPISLNEQQREAFAKLLNSGPLSLLQGPPGTGKTEFIAAFVHHLIETQNTRRILLVSQSHEAVNTAAERIRKHCAHFNTELEVVRFSNREGAVSTGLKDVYSQAITAEKRELFNAECKYRVEALSDALGLDAKFISSVVMAELKLFKKIDHLNALMGQIKDEAIDEDLESLKIIVIELLGSVRAVLRAEYDIELDENAPVAEVKDILLAKLCDKYKVSPIEARSVRALAKISRDMQNALTGERVNYDEFYARSRQLVTGTCVGIGQGHIGIHNNIYDWVIIDEAARSISSELAIAMQSAKRVLLVGDHLQLPPLYSDAHKKALAKKLGLHNERTDLDEILQSDFARAFNSEYGKQASAALLTQYRMADPIGNLVSKTFYEGKLLNGGREVPDIYSGVSKALENTVTWLDTNTLGARANHTEGRGHSIFNSCEADQIISVLKDISSNSDFVDRISSLVGKDEAAIGIICMYDEQQRLLRQKFNQEAWSDTFKSLVKIGTVDSYQGKENRIIILSLTRSDKRCSPGFLRTPNRINVAMSRAMDRLLIVGNSSMWRGHNKELPLGAVMEFMEVRGDGEGYQFIPAQHGGVRK